MALPAPGQGSTGLPANGALAAAREDGVDIISLQHNHGAEQRPGWARQVTLDTWEDTCEAIASCNLVITSCTSVSHLAAAIGIPTWVILPVLPYYLYALDEVLAAWKVT